MAPEEGETYGLEDFAAVSTMLVARAMYPAMRKTWAIRLGAAASTNMPPLTAAAMLS